VLWDDQVGHLVLFRPDAFRGHRDLQVDAVGGLVRAWCTRRSKEIATQGPGQEQEERTFMVLIVLLHQVAAHVAVLEHLLQLGGKSRPTLLRTSSAHVPRELAMAEL
jgi:hypothetical protein